MSIFVQSRIVKDTYEISLVLPDVFGSTNDRFRDILVLASLLTHSNSTRSSTFSSPFYSEKKASFD